MLEKCFADACEHFAMKIGPKMFVDVCAFLEQFRVFLFLSEP